MHTPLIAFTLTFVCGIVLGRFFLFFPLTALALLVAVICAGLVAAIRAPAGRVRTARAAAALLFGASLFLISAAWHPAPHYRSRMAFDRVDHRISGVIVSPLDRSPDRTAFLLELDAIDNAPSTGRIRATVRGTERLPGYGDRISARVKLFPPRDFRNPGGFSYEDHLARAGVFALASIRKPEDIVIHRTGGGLFRAIQDWREAARQTFRRQFTGDGAAVMQAMILGEEGDLTDAVRDRFMAAGVTHILSISGSHLGLVAMLAFAGVRVLLFLLPERAYHRLTIRTDPKKIAAVAAAAPVLFYALLAGGQPATIRSLIMIFAGLAALVLDREHRLAQALAIAALAILVPAPQSLFDISFQLSFLSVLSIIWVVGLRQELALPPAQAPLEKIRDAAILLLTVSIAAAAATGPLVAHYFNQIAPAGLIANIVIVPVAGIAIVPAGLLSAIIAILFGSAPAPGIVQWLADVFLRLVKVCGAIPFGSFRVAAPGLAALLLIAAAIYFAAAIIRTLALARYHPLRASLRPPRVQVIGLALSAAGAFALLVFAHLPQREAAVVVLDVGQGDSTLIQTPAGATILIDGGGTRDNRFDIGKRVVAPALWNRGIRRIDLAVLSHPHPDHMNGLISTLNLIPADTILWSGRDSGLPGRDRLEEVARSQGSRLRAIDASDRPFAVGDAVVRVLHPAPGYRIGTRKAYADENNRSLVVVVEVDGLRLLAAGDIHKEAEQAVLRTGQTLKCDILKAPHHGSKTSNTQPFVTAAAPSVAVISVGRGNPYGQPAAAVLDQYEQSGARLFRTDRDGAVIIRKTAAGLAVTCWDACLLRTATASPAAWIGQERENWKRLLLRRAAT